METLWIVLVGVLIGGMLSVVVAYAVGAVATLIAFMATRCPRLHLAWIVCLVLSPMWMAALSTLNQDMVGFVVLSGVLPGAVCIAFGYVTEPDSRTGDPGATFVRHQLTPTVSSRSRRLPAALNVLVAAAMRARQSTGVAAGTRPDNHAPAATVPSPQVPLRRRALHGRRSTRPSRAGRRRRAAPRRSGSSTTPSSAPPSPGDEKQRHVRTSRASG